MINSIQELMEQLKPYISLYMDEMGIKLDNNGFVKCLNPDHEDHNPSMHFWSENNLLFCFSCLEENQSVYTFEKGFIPIKEIKEGMHTLGLKGQKNKILKKIKENGKNKKIYKIFLGNNSEPIICTEEHKHFYTKWKNLPLNDCYDYRLNDTRLSYCKSKKRFETKQKLEIKKTSELQVKDFLFLPKTKVLEENKIIKNNWSDLKRKGPKVKIIKDFILNEDICWLFGIWLAEGSVYRGGIRFTINGKERNLAEKIKKIIEDNFNFNVTIFDFVEKKGSYDVCCSSTDMEKMFLKLFGKLCDKKNIPSNFINIEHNLQFSMLKGFLCGDGTKDNSDFGFSYFTTTNEQLAKILRLFAFNNNISTYISFHPSKYNEKDGITRKSYYNVIIRKNRRVDTIFSELEDGTKGCFLLIDKIEEIKSSEVVYDLKTEDSSILLDKAIIHNCGVTYDIFSLCSLLEGKPDCGPDFIEENVFYLARKYGLEYEHLRKDITQEEIKRNNMFKIMRIFGEYILNHKNQDYLNKRNINDKTSKELIIGSVDNYQNTINYIKEKVKINDVDELIKEIGFDSYKVNENKLIFIIKDRFGRPCSFVSREMVDVVNNPKYINGKESEIYNKSSIFYGFSDIKKKYNHLDVFLIVEGYIDFVSAYQAGFRNIVALGSASFTDEHINILEKDTNIDKIAIALDNDATGKKRTEDLINRFKLRKLKKTYVVAVNKSNKYKDLDEAIQDKLKNNEKLNLRDMYDIINLFEFELRKIKESGSYDESLVFENFINIISQTKSPKEREDQVKILSKYINYSSRTILDEIEYRLESDNEAYRNDIKKAFQYGSKEIEKNPNNAISVLESIKEDIEDIDKQYNKIKGDIFQIGLEDFDSYEEKKTIRDLFNINFHIPWLNNTALVPGTNTIIAGSANSGNFNI